MALGDFKGKITLVYGSAWVGKTTWVLSQLKEAKEKVLWLDFDRNFPVLQSAKQNKIKMSYRSGVTFGDLFSYLDSAKPEEYDVVVVDSLASLLGFLKTKLGNTIKTAEVSETLQEKLFRKLRKFGTVFVITHNSLIGNNPQIAQSGLRHVSVLVKVSNKNGKRVVSIQRRKALENPKFEEEGKNGKK